MISALVLLVELVLLFFLVSFAVEVAQRRVGPERLRAWMGGRPLVAALKGIAVGFVTPFCTYSAIPLLVGMRRAQVAPAGYVAFIVAAPVLDPVLFGALVLIGGLQIAVLYMAIAFSAALGLALVAQHARIDRHLKPLEPLAETRDTSMARLGRAVPHAASCGTVVPRPCAPTEMQCRSDASPAWGGWGGESRAAAWASLRLLRSMWLLLAVGVSLGLAIEALVPADAAARVTGSNAAVSIPTAAALGTPLYIHTELFVPMADSLDTAGVGIGTIVALTIAGAGANIPEFAILTRLADTRLVAAFFAAVFAVAVVGGFIAQALVG